MNVHYKFVSLIGPLFKENRRGTEKGEAEEGNGSEGERDAPLFDEREAPQFQRGERAWDDFSNGGKYWLIS